MLSRLKSRIIEPAPATSTVRGLSLHIGVNRVDPAHYGTDAPLAGCESDARAMAILAAALGYEVLPPLLTADATRLRVLDAVKAAATVLKPGDLFLLTYAGHGAQIPDESGDEPDGLEETWCLHDGMLLDDEVQRAIYGFQAGVRVVVVSDSCHSGTMTRAMILTNLVASTVVDPSLVHRPAVYRALDPIVASRVYRNNLGFYEEVSKATTNPPHPAADVISLGGCQDPQLSLDGIGHGLFTEKLLEVWSDGAFGGNYLLFHEKVQRLMPVTQLPKLDVGGVHDAGFPKRPAFRIGP